jgi:hypothetical protein
MISFHFFKDRDWYQVMAESSIVGQALGWWSVAGASFG